MITRPETPHGRSSSGYSTLLQYIFQTQSNHSARSFKTSRGSYFRDIGKIVFHRLSVRNFFAPFRRGLKRIDSGQRRAKQLQCPFFHDNRLAATGVGNFQIDAASQRIDGKIHPEVVNKVIRSIAVAIVNLSHTFHKRLPEQLNIVRTLK